MVEPTSDPSASSEPSPESMSAATAGAFARQNGEVTVQSLLEAGVHYGHQTRRWDPRMRPFIYGERNGIHIINLDQTVGLFQMAVDFLREITAGGGKVLFVGTKRQAQAPIRLEAERSQQFFVNNRWLGGTLTNFRTVKKSIDRFKNMLETVGDEEKSAELSKRELSGMNRQIEKYRKSLDGLKDMTRLPDAIVVIDVGKEHIAVSEGRRLGIPVVGVVDSNCSPDGIDYVIPGNDDAIRAVQLYCGQMADACLEGAEVHNQRVQAEVAEKEARRAPTEAAAPSSGRVVVEIKQPPRRSRGGGPGGPGGRGGPGGGGGGGRGHSAGGWNEGKAEAPAADAKPAEPAAATKPAEPAAAEAAAKPETKDSE